MPLKYAPEPTNGSTIVNDGLTRILGRPQGPPAALHQLSISSLQLQPPHAVFDLRADEVADGKGLESAHASGYRYLVSAPTGSLAAAEVQTDSSGTATLLANVNFGPFVGATERALAQLSSMKQVADGSYEVRLLRFAAIGLMALWLKSDAGGDDIVYPLAPAPAALKAETPYSAKHLLAAILPLAQQRAASKGQTVP